MKITIVEPTGQPKVKIYAMPQFPFHWIVKHGCKLFIVAARANGWDTRKPYKGRRVPTEDQACGIHNGKGFGLPPELA